MEATWDWSQVQQIVESMSLIVIEDDDLVLEHCLDIFLRIKIKPVLET